MVLRSEGRGLMIAGRKAFHVPRVRDDYKRGATGMALVALAGPLTNLILAYLGFLGMMFLGGGNMTMIQIFNTFMMVNLGFCCFNILPIPPLDGSRVLYAIAPDGVRRFLENIEMKMGVAFVYLFLVVFSAAISSVIFAMENGIFSFFRWTIGM